MNMNQLYYLIDIAKTSSMNTTARNMFITQPAVSEAIKKLEQELNCTILYRNKKGVEFTKEGKYVLQQAQYWIVQYEDLLEHFKQNEDSLSGVFKIGAASMITETLLQDVIFRMQEQYHNVSLYTKELTLDGILEELLEAKIDFGLFGYSNEYRSKLDSILLPYKNHFQLISLYTDSVVCVMHKNHLLSTKKELSKEDTAHFKYTLLNPNDLTKDLLNSHANCLHSSNNITIHKRFLREKGTLISTARSCAAQLFSEKDFVFIPMIDAHPIQFCLIFCQDRPLGTLEQIFIDFLIESAKNIAK